MQGIQGGTRISTRRERLGAREGRGDERAGEVPLYGISFYIMDYRFAEDFLATCHCLVLPRAWSGSGSWPSRGRGTKVVMKTTAKAKRDEQERKLTRMQ
jgi:hypothetical protein